MAGKTGIPTKASIGQKPTWTEAHTVAYSWGKERQQFNASCALPSLHCVSFTAVSVRNPEYFEAYSNVLRTGRMSVMMSAHIFEVIRHSAMMREEQTCALSLLWTTKLQRSRDQSQHHSFSAESKTLYMSHLPTEHFLSLLCFNCNCKLELTTFSKTELKMK